MLRADYTPQFERDVKALLRKHVEMEPLKEVIRLVLTDSPEAREILRQRHNAHRLRGSWAGSNECHVANAGNWLVIWKTGNGMAVFQRTGTHAQLFRR